MIKTTIAYTSELDDEKTAIEDLSSQINLEGWIMKNTIGIITCHYEFIHSGILKAVCAALPFNVVGTISSMQSTVAETGSLLMTLTVMTSDDVEFDMVITPSLMNEPGKVISESYKTISRPERPGLILAFAPFLVQNCGDEYVNVIAGLSGGVPCFGTIAVDDTLTFENCFMIANGEYYHDQMALVLIYGDIKPKFFIANISESRILEKKALVTKSEGHVLIEVNERPFIDYLDDLGLVKTSEIQYAMSSLPFLLDYNDGTPKVSKIFIMLTPDKHALCAGAMPEGSTLYMAMTDKDDVVLTTGEAVGKIAEDISGASLLLAYSCISRSMTMGSDIYREMEILKEKISGSLPFMMASSGGEICPTQILNGKATNRFHNNAFIACVL